MSDFTIKYIKNKSDILKTLEMSDLELNNAQNYIPLYENFFVLNETNWNKINLEHSKNLIECITRPEFNKIECKIYNSLSDNTETKNLFVKFSPLLDPIKFLVGKYDHTDETIFNLPKWNDSNCHKKVKNTLNSAYTDSFFSFLTSKLLNEYNFIHGLEFYGSFLGNLSNYKVNIFDDIEYICESTFFNKNKDSLFRVDEEYYSIVCDSDSSDGKKPLKLGEKIDSLDIEQISLDEKELAPSVMSLKDLDSNISTIDDIVMTNNDNSMETIKSLSTNSTCSSRSSHTDNESQSNDTDEEMDLDEENSDDDSYSSDEEEGEVFAYIDEFPVSMICIESCKKTLDSYAFSNEDDDSGVDVKPDEWLAILAQIIMQLIVYQNVFSFTHNDLHTNNIMYIETDKQYLYYNVQERFYKIPTFGKIWKIIDFGRAIYKIQGKLICSDSFSPGEDAATQYNCEPFFDANKPRLEPNFSFDLCRLGCALFDYFLEPEFIHSKEELDDVQKLILEWCTDDKGKNILYKKNGEERYPDFKLYKMIARNVHNQVPCKQLDKEYFTQFRIAKKKIKKGNKIFFIDELPNLSVEKKNNELLHI
tara:strand:+ start:3422 stop:5191 length:1770 start_codon:yes stop_codon:yes gene_type:complete